MKKVLILVISVAILFTFASCSMSGSDYSSAEAAPQMTESIAYSSENVAYDEEYAEDINFAATEETAVQEAEFTGDSAPTPDIENSALDSRKIIYTSYLDMETTNYNEAITAIEQKVSSIGGYVQSKYADSPTSEYASRYSTYTLKIPYNHYTSFMKSVGEIGSVLWSEETTEDVTLEYVDIESRLLTLNEERASLLALLSEATEVEEIVTIQQYLGDVQYEIESFTARQRQLDNLVQFCTVTVNIYEVKDYTPVENSFTEDIQFAMQNSIYNFTDNTKDFIIGLVYALPSLIVFAIFVIIAVIIIRKLIKRARKKSALMQENSQHMQYMPQQNYTMPTNAKQENNGAQQNSAINTIAKDETDNKTIEPEK